VFGRFAEFPEPCAVFGRKFGKKVQPGVMSDRAATARRIEAEKPSAPKVSGSRDVQQIQSPYIAPGRIPAEQICGETN